MYRFDQRVVHGLYVIRDDAPGATNDTSEGLMVGVRWLDTSVSPSQEYLCTDATDGAAVWVATNATDITNLIETSGPTTLAMGAWADGDVLVRSGSTAVGGGKPGAEIYETSGPTSLAVGAWADGKNLKRSGSTAVGSDYPATFVVKPSDQSKTALAVPSVDSALLFAIGASQTWEFELLALVTTDATVDGLKIAFSAPSGVAALHYSAHYAPLASAEDPGTCLRMASTGDSPAITVVLSETGALTVKGIVTNGATPGNVTFKWSQGASNAGALIVAAKSYLKATRIS